MNFVNILVKTHLLGEMIGKTLRMSYWSICLEPQLKLSLALFLLSPATHPHPCESLFVLLPDFLSKNFFDKMFLNVNIESKTCFETGNGIIKMGNGTISLTFLAPIKKCLLQNVSNFYQRVQTVLHLDFNV